MSPTLQAPPPAYMPAGSLQQLPKTVLRRWKSTFLLSFLFIALLVIPWILTCILDTRPIGGHIESWSLVNGTLGEDTVMAAEGWYRALESLRMVTAVLTIPVLSLVLNHAAVVLLQRRHPKQRLNALEMLSLVDAPWSRLSLGIRAPKFVYAAVALILFGVLQLIVQAALIVPEYIQVATWLDVPDAQTPDNSYDFIRYKTLGYDPNPRSLAMVPLNLVVKDVAAKMTVESVKALESYLWLDRAASDPDGTRTIRNFLDNTFYWYLTPPRDLGLEFFTSPFPAGTNTGVLRYLSTRLNSSVTCESVPSSTFPELCPGNRPFIGDTTIQDNGTDAARFRWCVPGDYNYSPWQPIRSRQDIMEDMFIQVNVPDNSPYSELYNQHQSFSIHCASRTTRGPFELPNYHNQDQTGPLLDSWPSPNEIYSNFNDRIGNSGTAPMDNDTITSEYLQWSYQSPDPYYTSSQITPGPLTVAMISMLGNGSWFHPLQNETTLSDEALAAATHLSICNNGAPFLSWDGSYDADVFILPSYGSCFDLSNSLQEVSSDTPSQGLARFAFEWFQAFNKTANVNRVLSAGMFFANEATLTRGTGSASSEIGIRAISYSAGKALVKPSVSQPAKIAISVLIGIEVVALIGLLVFIYLTPTFAKRIDAATTAVLGAHLFSSGIQIPHLGLMNPKTLKSLEGHDGLIGVNRGFDGDSRTHDAPDIGGRRDAGPNEAHDHSPLFNEIEMGDLSHPPQAADMLEAPVGSLVLGGRGLVTRRVIHTKTAASESSS